MPFQNLLDTFEWPVLKLPVGDVVYEIPEVSAENYVRLVAMVADMKNNPQSDPDVFTLVLGADLYAKLQAEVPHSQVQVIATTAYFWQLRLHDAAEEFWNSGGKALRDLVQTPTRTRKPTSTAAGTTTRRRASGTGTSTRKNSRTKTTV